MQQEIRRMKDLKNHEGFKCDDTGVIYGKRGKPLVGRVDRCGYRNVLLSENGVSTQYLAHRLVLAAFNPIDNMDKYDVNHKNGNKLDNRIENLEWCTRSENIRHSYINGLQNKITNPHGTFRVLTTTDLETIRSLHNKGYVDREIASTLGCSREIISRKIRRMGLR